MLRIDEELLKGSDVLSHSVQFYSDDQTVLNGRLYRPADAGLDKLPVSLIVPSEGLTGSEKSLPIIQHQLRQKRNVFVCELRGTGMGTNQGLSPLPNLDSFGSEFILNTNYYNAGKSLLGLRVYDILRMVDFLAEQQDMTLHDLTVFGDEIAALCLLFAANLDKRINAGTLTGILPSFETVLSTPDYQIVSPFRFAVHGILKYFDIPQLIKELPEQKFLIKDFITI